MPRFALHLRILLAALVLLLAPATPGAHLAQRHEIPSVGRLASGISDPIAALNFALRLQTHRGDNIPLGLYQDTACTIPATEDGHSIAAWRDELSDSGLVALQSNSVKRPTLRFVNGVPVVRFDGVDDFMATAPFLTETEISAFAICSRPWTENSDYRKLLAKGADNMTDGFAMAQMGATNFGWQIGDLNAFGQGYNNASGATAAGPTSLTDGQTVVWAVRLAADLGRAWIDGEVISTRIEQAFAVPADSNPLHIGNNFGSGQEWDGDIAAVLLAPSVDRLIVEAYLNSL